MLAWVSSPQPPPNASQPSVVVRHTSSLSVLQSTSTTRPSTSSPAVGHTCCTTNVACARRVRRRRAQRSSTPPKLIGCSTFRCTVCEALLVEGDWVELEIHDRVERRATSVSQHRGQILRKVVTVGSPGRCVPGDGDERRRCRNSCSVQGRDYKRPHRTNHCDTATSGRFAQGTQR